MNLINPRLLDLEDILEAAFAADERARAKARSKRLAIHRLAAAVAKLGPA